MRRGRLSVAVIERRRSAREGAQRAESKGRPVGRVEGSWVTDLAELRQSILLCSFCDPKWRASASKYGYELTKRWTKIWGGVIGKCDGCRQSGVGRSFYAHGSIIGDVYDHNAH